MFRTRNDSRAFARTRSLISDGAPAGKAQRGVALFHVGRSGSTVLGDLLDQNSALHWDGEIYEHAFQRVERKTGPLFLPSNTSPFELRAQPWSALLPSDALEYLRRRIAQTQKRVYGFEVKFFHLRFFGMSLVDYVEGLKGLGFDAFVILKRRNLLKMVVSSLVAAQRKQYHFRNAQGVQRRSIVLDPEKVANDREQKPLLEFFEKYEAMFALLEELLIGERMLELIYEDDLLEDPQHGHRKVCEFLKLECGQPTVNFVRSTPFSLREIVVNFDDVVRTLRDTPYAWMLDE